MFQNYVLAILGMFPFMRQTVPYQSLSRDTSWRHPTNSVVGAMPKTQFIGKDADSIQISCRLIPELTGGSLSIAALRLMADSGGSFPLIEGSTFLLLGFYVIESIHEEQSELFGDGAARAIDFSMQLKRTDDPSLLAIAENIMSNF
ncbi:phage tail protein [Actinobacillus porcinus]|uniref:phage tail protein n=1 Tax=Actinobacillus porcinus TaxID=51048 RepID=UPI002352B26C|nr:phage tail protein [Actinobacillus porcinus]MCI5763126.1 phage tail protein [Actinobacillus porcinus]MDY5421187.1 phage tail protein [Actinobacillus porcinus]